MGRFAFLKNPNNMVVAMMGTVIMLDEIVIRLFQDNPQVQSIAPIFILSLMFGGLALVSLFQREAGERKGHFEDLWSDIHNNDGRAHRFLERVWFLGMYHGLSGDEAAAFQLEHEPADIGEFKEAKEGILLIRSTSKKMDAAEAENLFYSTLKFHSRKGAADRGTEIGFDHPNSARGITKLSPLPFEVMNRKMPIQYLVWAEGMMGDAYSEWRKFSNELTTTNTEEIINLLVKGKKTELELAKVLA